MQVEAQRLTVDEYLAYGDQPVEVIDGEVVLMAAAHTRGQPNVVTNLFRGLEGFVHKHKMGKVFTEASFVLDGNPRSRWVKGARTPDLSFITLHRIQEHNAKYPASDPFWLAPDLAVEVISPTDSYEYLSQKVSDYLRYGVRLVWVIDPAARAVRAHTPDQPLGFTLREGDKLTAEPVVAGWSIKVADLFSDD